MVSPTRAALSLTHLNFDVADLDASERFYRDELCLPITRNSAALRLRTPNFLLVLAHGTPRIGGDFYFGFRVASTADVDGWFARFAERNVPIIEQPVQRGAVYVGRVTDPDGYIIEVYCDI